jgi:hypothetical protein
MSASKLAPENVNEEALALRYHFDRFMRFNPQPSDLSTTEARLATAKRSVALAAMRNAVHDLGVNDDDFQFNLEADICGEHDATAIPLYLHLAHEPDRAVQVWAEEMERKYRLSLDEEPDFTDFVVETCSSFYAAAERFAEDEMLDELDQMDLPDGGEEE